MLRPFFSTAMRAPARHLTFRRTVALHVVLLTCLGWTAAKATTPATLSVIGQLALVLGILEGGALVGWRLTQLPKSQALEFLLVSPLQPRRVFLAEMLVGIARFALVCLAGLPVLLAMVLGGAIVPLDLWTLGLMPFAWGVVAGFGLTVWAYEPARVRRIGERIGLCCVLVYLVVSSPARTSDSGSRDCHDGSPNGVQGCDDDASRQSVRRRALVHSEEGPAVFGRCSSR